MNLDARIAVGLPNHPKTKKLARRVGDAGVLRFVWLILYASQNRPNGDLSGMSAEDIEIAVDWLGEPGAFVAALADVGFLDGAEGSYKLHDWPEHNPWAAGAETRRQAARKAGLIRRYGEDRGLELFHADQAHRSPKTSAPLAGRSLNGSGNERTAGETIAGRTPPYPSPSPSPIPTKEEKKAPDGAVDRDTTIWTLGVSLLTKAGQTDKGARTFLGKHAKGRAQKLAEVIAHMSLHPVADPIAYIEGAMRVKEAAVLQAGEYD